MRTLPVLDQLPVSYTVQRHARGFAAMHESVRDDLERIGWGPVGDVDLDVSELQGRRPLFELNLGDEVLLVRRFTHGGLMRWATGERFRDPERPFREILLSEHLHRHGIPTPRVAAARARAAPGGSAWYLEVLTRRVPDASDLGFELAALQRKGSLELADRLRLRRILRALGALTGRMHRSGFLHADFNPNNILVERASLADPELPGHTGNAEHTGDTGGARLWVLDLDRSTLHEALDEGRRTRNIARLFRHVQRRERSRGRVLQRSDGLRFLRAYGLEGEAWKRVWRGIEAEQGGEAWHRLGWALERCFGGKDPRGAL